MIGGNGIFVDVWMNMFVGLCLCVSVYDLTDVFYGFDFLGLRNRYPCVCFFFF